MQALLKIFSMVKYYPFRRSGYHTGHHRIGRRPSFRPPRREVREVRENREPINTNINGINQGPQRPQNSLDIPITLLPLLFLRPENLAILDIVLSLLPPRMHPAILPVLVNGLFEEQQRQFRIIHGLSEKLSNTKSVLDNISDIPESQRKCVICLSEFKSRDEINKLECGHVFHFSCLGEEIKHRQRCPICMASLLP